MADHSNPSRADMVTRKHPHSMSSGSWLAADTVEQCHALGAPDYKDAVLGVLLGRDACPYLHCLQGQAALAPCPQPSGVL